MPLWDPPSPGAAAPPPRWAPLPPFAPPLPPPPCGCMWAIVYACPELLSSCPPATAGVESSRAGMPRVIWCCSEAVARGAGVIARWTGAPPQATHDARSASSSAAHSSSSSSSSCRRRVEGKSRAPRANLYIPSDTARAALTSGCTLRRMLLMPPCRRTVRGGVNHASTVARADAAADAPAAHAAAPDAASGGTSPTANATATTTSARVRGGRRWDGDAVAEGAAAHVGS